MRIEGVIVNSSPLIALFRCGQQELLPRLFKDILVPDAVWREIMAAGHEDAVARALLNVEWLKRMAPAVSDPLVLAWDLGPGET